MDPRLSTEGPVGIKGSTSCTRVATELHAMRRACFGACFASNDGNQRTGREDVNIPPSKFVYLIICINITKIA